MQAGPVAENPVRNKSGLWWVIVDIERRVAEDRRDCYWLYVMTGCNSQACLQEPIKDPARFPWHEVKKVDHYYLSVDALTQPMQVREQREPYGGAN
jgi:hypothetical protein